MLSVFTERLCKCAFGCEDVVTMVVRYGHKAHGSVRRGTVVLRECETGSNVLALTGDSSAVFLSFILFTADDQNKSV